MPLPNSWELIELFEQWKNDLVVSGYSDHENSLSCFQEGYRQGYKLAQEEKQNEC